MLDTHTPTLQSQVHGSVISPSDAQYDAVRQGWNLAVTQHPALIVVAANADDVAAAVQYANRHDMPIAVQATGHGVVRPADDCLLIVMADMNQVSIDADARTAWVSGGAMWQAVLEPAQALGLAPLLGSSPGVGAIGYTLGGGMGWLARHYGLSADSVNTFEIVTADGELRRASVHENPDLFWALRGGGGSFGVVTGMEIKLYPVTEVYGGSLLYPIDQAKAVFTRYQAWIADAEEALTSSIAIMNFPPIPDIPEPVRGKSFVIVRGCYSGDLVVGKALVDEWRAWQAPFLDDFRVMPFSEVASISQDPEEPIPGKSTTAWLRDINHEVADAVIQYMQQPTITILEIRHAGGAVAKVAPRDAAYGNREAEFLMQLIGIAPSSEAIQAFTAYTDELKQVLQPHLTGGVYMNFLEGEESRSRVRDGYVAENFARLGKVKAAYDPDNRFGHSFNIQPVK